MNAGLLAAMLAKDTGRNTQHSNHDVIGENMK